MRKFSLALVALVSMAGCSDAASVPEGRWQVYDPANAGFLIDELALTLNKDGTLRVEFPQRHVDAPGTWQAKTDAAPASGYDGVIVFNVASEPSITCSYKVAGEDLTLTGCPIQIPADTVFRRSGDAAPPPQLDGTWAVMQQNGTTPIEGAALILDPGGALWVKSPLAGNSASGTWAKDTQTKPQEGFTGAIRFTYSGTTETCSYNADRWELTLDPKCGLDAGNGLRYMRK